MMKKGTVLMVYEDPITKLREEGRAELVEPIIQPDTEIQDIGEIEYWNVRFKNEPGRLFPRWVSN